MNYLARYRELTDLIDRATRERSDLLAEWANEAPWKVGDIIKEEDVGSGGKPHVGTASFRVDFVYVNDVWWNSRGEPRFVARGSMIRKDGSIGIRQLSAVRSIAKEE